MSEFYEDVNINPVDQSLENKIVNTALTAVPVPHISGLKLKADIAINGLTLNTIDENSVVWIVSEIDGWWTLPESELPDLPRGWGDGSYDAIGRWATRLITLSGSFLPQKPEDALVARNKLLEAITLIKIGGWLTVYEDPLSDNPRGAYVRLSGVPQITSVNARGRHDFSIGLKAVDPTKYEYIDGSPDGYQFVDIPSGGSVSVTNSGNISVPVVFEIIGPLASVSPSNPAVIFRGAVLNGSPVIKIIGSTTSSQALEIDSYNREVLLVENEVVSNGRAKVAILVDWIYLEPGQNTLRFTDPSPGTSTKCRVYWRSGWIG